MNPFRSLGVQPAFANRLIAPILIMAVFGLGGSRPAFLLIPYFALFMISLRPFPTMYGSLEATEFILLLGYTRRDLVRAYVQSLLITSALHALGFVGAWALRGFDRVGIAGLDRAWLPVTAFACFFFIQVLVRSTLLLFLNARHATCLPAGWRGAMAGDVSWNLPIVLLVSAILVALPIATFVWALAADRPLIMSVAAGAYFLALLGILRSAELSTGPSVWVFNHKVRKGRLSRTTRTRSVLASLLWHGLNRWVWATFALCLTPLAVVVILKVAIPDRMGEDPFLVARMAWFGLAFWWILLLAGGGRIFRWSSEDESGELIHMAGVPISRLRRLKLLASAAIVLGAALLCAAAFTGTVPLGFRDDVWGFVMRGSGGFLLPVLAAHLLLWTNESRVVGAYRGTHVASLLRIVAFIVLIVIFVGERLTSKPTRDIVELIGEPLGSPAPLGLGLALLAPAVVLWIIGWSRAAERD